MLSRTKAALGAVEFARGNPFTGRGLAHFPGEFARGDSFCQEVVQRGPRENVPVPLSWPVNGYAPGNLGQTSELERSGFDLPHLLGQRLPERGTCRGMGPGAPRLERGHGRRHRRDRLAQGAQVLDLGPQPRLPSRTRIHPQILLRRRFSAMRWCRSKAERCANEIEIGLNDLQARASLGGSSRQRGGRLDRQLLGRTDLAQNRRSAALVRRALR